MSTENTVKIQINGTEVEVKAGSTILAAAQKMNIHIPTLCHHPDLEVAGICRICVVEVEGERLLQAACATPVRDGMNIKTFSKNIRQARRTILELMLSNHYGECFTCENNRNCELRLLAAEYGVGENMFGRKEKRDQVHSA